MKEEVEEFCYSVEVEEEEEEDVFFPLVVSPGDMYARPCRWGYAASSIDLYVSISMDDDDDDDDGALRSMRV